MDFPTYSLGPSPILSPFSPEMEAFLSDIWGNTSAAGLDSATSGTWTVANKALFYPFRLTEWATAYQLLIWTGATASGNVSVGIYDSQKNLIVSGGPTAQGTVNTIQVFDITNTVLPPGEYLLACAASATTVTVFRRLLHADEAMLSMFPLYEQTGLTNATLTNPGVPVISTEASPPVIACGIQFVSTF